MPEFPLHIFGTSSRHSSAAAVYETDSLVYLFIVSNCFVKIYSYPIASDNYTLSSVGLCVLPEQNAAYSITALAVDNSTLYVAAFCNTTSKVSLFMTSLAKLSEPGDSGLRDTSGGISSDDVNVYVRLGSMALGSLQRSNIKRIITLKVQGPFIALIDETGCVFVDKLCDYSPLCFTQIYFDDEAKALFPCDSAMQRSDVLQTSSSSSPQNHEFNKDRACFVICGVNFIAAVDAYFNVKHINLTSFRNSLPPSSPVSTFVGVAHDKQAHTFMVIASAGTVVQLSDRDFAVMRWVNVQSSSSVALGCELVNNSLHAYGTNGTIKVYDSVKLLYKGKMQLSAYNSLRSYDKSSVIFLHQSSSAVCSCVLDDSSVVLYAANSMTTAGQLPQNPIRIYSIFFGLPLFTDSVNFSGNTMIGIRNGGGSDARLYIKNVETNATSFLTQVPNYAVSYLENDFIIGIHSRAVIEGLRLLRALPPEATFVLSILNIRTMNYVILYPLRKIRSVIYLTAIKDPNSSILHVYFIGDNRVFYLKNINTAKAIQTNVQLLTCSFDSGIDARRIYVHNLGYRILLCDRTGCLYNINFSNVTNNASYTKVITNADKFMDLFGLYFDTYGKYCVLGITRECLEAERRFRPDGSQVLENELISELVFVVFDNNGNCRIFNKFLIAQSGDLADLPEGPHALTCGYCSDLDTLNAQPGDNANYDISSLVCAVLFKYRHSVAVYSMATTVKIQEIKSVYFSGAKSNHRLIIDSRGCLNMFVENTNCLLKYAPVSAKLVIQSIDDGSGATEKPADGALEESDSSDANNPPGEKPTVSDDNIEFKFTRTLRSVPEGLPAGEPSSNTPAEVLHTLPQNTPPTERPILAPISDIENFDTSPHKAILYNVDTSKATAKPYIEMDLVPEERSDEEVESKVLSALSGLMTSIPASDPQEGPDGLSAAKGCMATSSRDLLLKRGMPVHNASGSPEVKSDTHTDGEPAKLEAAPPPTPEVNNPRSASIPTASFARPDLLEVSSPSLLLSSPASGNSAHVSLSPQNNASSDSPTHAELRAESARFPTMHSQVDTDSTPALAMVPTTAPIVVPEEKAETPVVSATLLVERPLLVEMTIPPGVAPDESFGLKTPVTVANQKAKGPAPDVVAAEVPKPILSANVISGILERIASDAAVANAKTSPKRSPRSSIKSISESLPKSNLSVPDAVEKMAAKGPDDSRPLVVANNAEAPGLPEHDALVLASNDEELQHPQTASSPSEQAIIEQTGDHPETPSVPKTDLDKEGPPLSELPVPHKDAERLSAGYPSDFQADSDHTEEPSAPSANALQESNDEAVASHADLSLSQILKPSVLSAPPAHFAPLASADHGLSQPDLAGQSTFNDSLIRTSNIVRHISGTRKALSDAVSELETLQHSTGTDPDAATVMGLLLPKLREEAEQMMDAFVRIGRLTGTNYMGSLLGMTQGGHSRFAENLSHTFNQSLRRDDSKSSGIANSRITLAADVEDSEPITRDQLGTILNQFGANILESLRGYLDQK